MPVNRSPWARLGWPPPAQAGFTLTELVVTVVILGFSLLVLLPLVQSLSHSPDPMIRQKATAFGQALMDEILSKRWDENTPIGGGPICTTESPGQASRPSLVDDCQTRASLVLGPDATETSRSRYDDVDDYRNYAEPDASGGFYDQQGNRLAGFSGYSRKVMVRYLPSTTTVIDENSPPVDGTTDSKLVVVAVTSPLSETFYLVAVVCNL